jgi:nucleotide-binding universal stress UspA family protein
MNTLVIGYEPTPQGEDAVVLGGLLAEALDATPVVTTVLHWPRHQMPREDLERALDEETRETFASIRASIAPAEVRTRAVASASPPETLFEVATTEDARLVVLGSTHRAGLGRVYPGSVGAAMLHGGPCAIAVAPRGFAAGDPRLLRIGVGFNGSTEAWAALETAIGLAQRTRARLFVLTAIEPPGYGVSASMPTAAEFRDYELENKRRLHDLGLAKVPDDLPVESSLVHGSAAAVLTDASTDLDLIVVGSRGYGPIRRALLGSTSAKLIRRAECPVIVLPRGAEDPLGTGTRAGFPGAGASGDPHRRALDSPDRVLRRAAR